MSLMGEVRVYWNPLPFCCVKISKGTEVSGIPVYFGGKEKPKTSKRQNYASDSQSKT